MKTFGGNSGYIGYSMSKRAANARNEGAYPKTDFKKEYGLTAKVFDALKDLKIIYVSEWHHTSKFGNRTDFYRWNEDKYINIYERNEKEIKKLVGQIGSQPKMGNILSVEEIQEWDKAFQNWTQKKKEILKTIQDIFYNEDN